MISLWAENGSEVTCVDITPNAISETKKRFELWNLHGEFMVSDGENLPFNDNSFDFVYSWGVLHHTEDTPKSVSELYRVLKPGGIGATMLYNKNSFLNWLSIHFNEGYLHLEHQFLTDAQLNNRYGDDYRNEGTPITKVHSVKEIETELFKDFDSPRSIVFGGTDIHNVISGLIPSSDNWIPDALCNLLGRFWGWSVWTVGYKR